MSGFRPQQSQSLIGSRLLAAAAVFFAAAGAARADLDAYVKKPDPSFAWSVQGEVQTPLGTITTIDLASQTWQEIVWKHNLTVYSPKDVPAGDAMLFFITGGGTGSKPDEGDHSQGFGLARLCGARVAVLHQAPNQPLLGDKAEDALIAETFVRYLETKDENWPLLFPMVKSAVRGMDAVQAWAKDKGLPAVTRFVVTGASKRGWTTWLTGAVDDRVIAIAPMVIVMLNLGPQGPNQLKVWGKYSEQIDDYVQRGLMSRTQTEDGKKLWTMVDPFTFRERLKKPKMLINGTNDRYWTLDAIDFYWDDLIGPKYLVELPNAGHGLDKNRDWALHGLGVFFRHVTAGRPMPTLAWTKSKGADGTFTWTVHANAPPKAARLWQAHSATRDFRESPWESTPLAPALEITGKAPDAADNLAFMIELEYELDGLDYHLTTSFFEPKAP